MPAAACGSKQISASSSLPDCRCITIARTRRRSSSHRPASRPTRRDAAGYQFLKHSLSIRRSPNPRTPRGLCGKTLSKVTAAAWLRARGARFARLRILPDLSPVSIRLALLFLLLRAWRMERKKKRPTRPKSRALFQQHRPKAEVAEARHLANAHILGIRHAVVDVIAGLRRGEAEP
jgi:hypothetical protein